MEEMMSYDSKSAWGNIYHFINYEKVKVALIVATIFRLQNILQGYRIHMDLFIYAIKSQGSYAHTK